VKKYLPALLMLAAIAAFVVYVTSQAPTP